MPVRADHLRPLAFALPFLFAGTAALAAVSQVDETAFSGGEQVRDFEEFTPNSDVVDTQYAGVGVTFDSVSGGWPVERHEGYGPTFAAAALAQGAGVQGLFHLNDGEEILFDPPVTRLGFQFGSNVPVSVPVTLFRGAAPLGSFDLVASGSELPFFGFEDPEGIDRIAFGVEQNNELVSQLDNLRFEREPTGSVALVGPEALAGAPPALDFEAFTPNLDFVLDQFPGVTFDSVSGGWPVERHEGYGPTFAAAALAQGAGVQGLFHLNAGEEILFDPPAVRVAFQFGSNVDVRVPIAFFRGGVEVGTAEIRALGDELPFFGFESLDGIDRIAFGVEQNDEFVSQLDNVRFEAPEPGSGAGAAAGAALALLARRRRRAGEPRSE